MHDLLDDRRGRGHVHLGRGQRGRHRNGGYRTIGLALGVFRLSLVKGEWFAVRQTRDLHVVRSPKDTTAVTPMPTFHLDDLIDVIRDAQRQSTTSP